MSAAVSLPEFTAFSPSAFAMSWLFVGLLPSLISEGRSFSLWMMPVGTKYGHSTEQRIWSVTSERSWYSVSLIETTAFFVTLYEPMLGMFTMPAIDAVLAMCPSYDGSFCAASSIGGVHT